MVGRIEETRRLEKLAHNEYSGIFQNTVTLADLMK